MRNRSTTDACWHLRLALRDEAAADSACAAEVGSTLEFLARCGQRSPDDGNDQAACQTFSGVFGKPMAAVVERCGAAAVAAAGCRSFPARAGVDRDAALPR